MNDIVYWIWLSLCCTPDTSTFSKLIYSFDDAKSIFEADEKEISRCVGFKNSDRAALLEKNIERAKGIYEFCTKHGVGLLPFSDEKYPSSLREIPTPPVLLYYRGTLPDFDKDFFVAGVGTRSLSDYGRRNAFKISYDLASAGATVVSGMAIGIDAVCHSGAIAAGGRTVAVLGSGIDVCYPAQHLTLAREIVKRGCVITEYAPGTQPNKTSFPKRNRIISGLSSATIVFEGRERSGSLITARYAKEQGRRVYALPASVGTKHAEVTNLLIKNGASVCTSAEDVLKDFGEIYAGVLNPFKLKEVMSVNLHDVLSSLQVVAICQGDDVFSAPYKNKTKRTDPIIKKDSRPEPREEKREDVTSDVVDPPPNFDKAALKIYKKIPFEGACAIESLVDVDMNLRDVMKALLKLEMNKLVVMLPGEKVSRKSK